jgi:hypothetical protein
MFLRVQNEAKKEAGDPVEVKSVANDGAFVSQPQSQAQAQPQAQPNEIAPAENPVNGKSTQYTELKMTLHQRLLDMINLSVIDRMEPEEFRVEIGETA